MAIARGLAWPGRRLTGHQTAVDHKHSICFLVQFPSNWSRASTYIRKTEALSDYWLWLLLDISAVSVVIVIIAICDIRKQEFSLRERVYIHNTYMKSRKSCSETRRKFQIKFPGRPVANPSTIIRRQAKWFKETGSVKNGNVNCRRHVLTEEMRLVRN